MFTARSLIRLMGIPALVAIAAFAAFGQSLFHGFAPSDDAFLVVNNLAVRGMTWENLRTVFTSYDPELYIPLTFVSYQIDYLIGGLDPFLYHLTNIFLHILNSLLVVWILTLLTGRKTLGIVGGLLFAVHPIHTEAIAWIAGRKDLLSALFFFFAFALYMRYRQGWRLAFTLSLGCFLLALLSKAMAVTLPLVLILYDLCLEERRSVKHMVMEKIPYFVLSVLFVVVALGGKERVLASSSAWETILMACKSTTFYLLKLFVPMNLTIIYPYHGSIDVFSTAFLPSVITVTIVIGAALLAWRNDKRWLTFGILFFLITLIPTYSNFHKAGLIFFAVDRYAYVPSVGILFIVMTVFGRIFTECSTKPLLATGSVIAALFCLLSIKQTQTWTNPETLYIHALKLYPESVAARASLANVQREAQQYEQAFATLKGGLPYGDHVLLRMGAGTIYARVGQVADAREQFTKAGEMDPENPEPLFALGSLDEQTGNTIHARELYMRAIELDGSYVAARVRLGKLFLADKQPDEAEAQFTEALAWNPNAVDAHVGLASIFLLKNDQEAARDHLEQALALDPQHREAMRMYELVDGNDQ